MTDRFSPGQERALTSVLVTGQRPSRLQRHGRYTRESMRHPGKMLPAIASQVISALTEPGDLVVDPMCGIGTSLVEAVHLGRDAAGVEYEPEFVHLTLGNLRHAHAQGATGTPQLVCGDARNIATIYASLRGKAALALTSPPYGSYTHGQVRSGRDNGGGSVTKRHHRYSADRGNLAHQPLPALLDGFGQILAGTAMLARRTNDRVAELLGVLQLGLCGRWGRARYETRRTARHAARIATPGTRLRAYETPERLREWHRARERFIEAESRRVKSMDAYVGTPRPSPVMVWTPEQTGVFLDRAAAHRLYALYHLIAFRGLRRGEACGLRWADVDLDEGTIRVCWQITQVGGDTEQGRPKSEAGERQVTLDKHTIKEIAAHRARQNQERLAAGERWDDSGFVFTGENGDPLDPALVSGQFLLLSMEAGLPPIRLHDLRHGAATILLRAGHDLKVVQETLGLSSITIASDTYTSVLPDLARQSAEDAAAILLSARTKPNGKGSRGQIVPLSQETRR